MTLTAEANRIADYATERLNAAAELMRSIQRTIDADMASALLGTPTREHTGPPRPCCDDAPDCDHEAPTGHHDPTGDIAISGAVASVKRRELRITDAWHDIENAIHAKVEHLHRVIVAEIRNPAPPVEVKPSDLCANAPGCSKLKADGSEWCDQCGLERDKQTRHGAPRCWTCGERPVESYRNAQGLAFRRMELTDDGWQAKADGAPPQCEPCRRADERRVVA